MSVQSGQGKSGTTVDGPEDLIAALAECDEITYTMVLCGDCSSGPPCRCSSDTATVERVWANGAVRWVATFRREV